ncbi:hypothetical protein [Flavobacterium fluviatile]|uniref:hypothetical protein n=1 Tax=Flavobacterium fluviatile TaxID=1862387 RepID=UPI0013D83952|nr:hypothetical protein [Flavobacterium fluviatile]
MKNRTTLKTVVVILYIFILTIFSLVARNMLNVCLPNEYILVKKIKIESISKVVLVKNSGGSYYLALFKDGMKTGCVALIGNSKMNLQTYKNIILNGNKTIDVVKMKNCRIFGCPEEYFLYDERFFCDSNNQCNYKDEYIKKYIFYLFITLIVFSIISLGFYKLYKSRFVNE